MGSSPLETGGAGSAGSAGNAQGGAVSHVWQLPLQPLFLQVEGTLLANPTLTVGNQLFCTVQQQQGTNPEPKSSLVEHVDLVATPGLDPSPLTFGELGKPDASSPAISLDGTELWLGMNTGSGTDIYRSTPQGDTWTKPEAVTAPPHRRPRLSLAPAPTEGPTNPRRG